jgi:hypothetical protein
LTPSPDPAQAGVAFDPHVLAALLCLSLALVVALLLLALINAKPEGKPK